MTGSESKDTTKIVSFNGDDAKWREWSVKAKAVGAKKGWLKMLEKDHAIDKTKVDTDTMKLVQLNDDANHFLTMSCTDKAFPYVENGGGNAYKAWVSLLARYNEVDVTDLTELHKEFNICKMKNYSDDPNLWFMELEFLKTRITFSVLGKSISRK